MGEEKVIVKITDDGVFHNEIKVKLKETAFNVLRYLILNPGRQEFSDIDRAISKGNYEGNNDTISVRMSQFKNDINKIVFLNNEYVINVRKAFRYEDLQVENMILDIQLSEEIPSKILNSKIAIGNYFWNLFKNINIGEEQFDIIHSFVIPPILERNRIDISKSDNRYLIKAPNSYGKSTLLKNIMLSLNYCTGMVYGEMDYTKSLVINQIRGCMNAEKNKQYLALYINANDESSYSKMDWLYKMSIGINKGIISDGDFKALVEYFYKKNRLVVLVDSLDETKKNNREKFNNKLEELLGNYSNIKVIAATRPILEDNNAFFDSYRLLNIDALEPSVEVVNGFVQRYANGNDDIITKICENPYLHKFVSTPYMLSRVILELLVNKNENIKGVYPIIKNVIENELLDRFVQNRDDIDRRLKRIGIIKKIYQNIAYEMATSGIRDFMNNNIKFAGIIENIINIVVEDNPHFNDLYGEDPGVIANDIYTHHSLLVTTEGKIKFISQDVTVSYFAAEYLVRVYLNEFKIKVENNENEETMISSSWKVIELINNIREEYMCATLSFMLVKMHEQGKNIVDNIGITEADVFKCLFVHCIEEKVFNTKVMEKLRDIFDTVFSDEMLGLDSFKDNFEEVTGKKVIDLIG